MVFYIAGKVHDISSHSKKTCYLVWTLKSIGRNKTEPKSMILEQKSKFLILIHLPLTLRQGDLQSIMIKFASQCGFEIVAPSGVLILLCIQELNK
jgi:hypothetical protein